MKIYRHDVSYDTILYIRKTMLESTSIMPSWRKLEKELKISRKVMLSRLKENNFWDYKERCVK